MDRAPRRYVGGVCLAAVGAVLLCLGTARRASAFSSCDLSGTHGSAPHGWADQGFISDVTPEEGPAYMYVNWGDGSSSYQQSDGTGFTAFDTGEHDYGAPGVYYQYLEVGTVGGGTCTYAQFFLDL